MSLRSQILGAAVGAEGLSAFNVASTTLAQVSRTNELVLLPSFASTQRKSSAIDTFYHSVELSRNIKRHLLKLVHPQNASTVWAICAPQKKNAVSAPAFLADFYGEDNYPSWHEGGPEKEVHDFGGTLELPSGNQKESIVLAHPLVAGIDCVFWIAKRVKEQ
eukprot:scaffold261_cov336-Pavlova_lutheri.AAC.8